MSESKVEFKSVVFNEEAKTFMILDGTEGTYSCNEIMKCSIKNEEAKYRGKTKPFLHQVLGGTAFLAMMGGTISLCWFGINDEGWRNSGNLCF